jgi:cytochrome c oxidase cbb3-type subunit I/II
MRIGRRDNLWHFNHFLDPRQTSPGSNMPPYPWLFEAKADFKALPKRIAVQSTLGVPWPAMSRDQIEQSARDQAMEIAESLVKAGAFLPDRPDLSPENLRRHLAESQVVAMIAYVQKVGTYEVIAPKENPSRTLNPDATRQTSQSKN